MKTYLYKEARQAIDKICAAAKAGEYDTREKFISMLEQNDYIAVQGYNPHGKIFHWNNASTLAYGHSEAAAVNKDLFDLILPAEIRPLARAAVKGAMITGRLPEASPCDLLRRNGEIITVYSGHLVFKWNCNSPEFYCLDLPIDEEEAGSTDY